MTRSCLHVRELLNAKARREIDSSQALSHFSKRTEQLGEERKEVRAPPDICTSDSLDLSLWILFCELRIWKLSSVCEYRCFLNKNPSTSNSRFLKLLPHRIISNLVETAASVMQDGNFNQLKREGVQEPHADFIVAMAQRSSTFTPCRFAWGINGGCSICLHLIYGLHEPGGIQAPVSRCPGVTVCEKPGLSPKLKANENRACDIICIGWTPHHTRSSLQYSWRSQSARRHEGRWLGRCVSAVVQTDVTRMVRSESGKCKSSGLFPLVWTLLFVVTSRLLKQATGTENISVQWWNREGPIYPKALSMAGGFG